MPQLLLELFCEEIPARMQAKAAADLERMLGERLSEAGFGFDNARTLVGPRRLTAVFEGLPVRSEDVREERKGPRVGAPEKAIEGFLRGAGVASLEACETRSDKKGDYYVAVLERPGRLAADVIAETVPDVVRSFPWPKSMRWGRGTLRWVRPLQRVLCVFDGRVVDFEIEGLRSGEETEGHRLMGRGPFSVSSFDEYRDTLEGAGKVVLDREERKRLIETAARKACADAGFELVEDRGLLEEVAGLAEWPVVLLGDMDPAFLDLPPEVIRLSMRVHQKYFAVRDPKTGGLAPHFVVVANQEAPDGGAAIAAGNARVLSARLSDARHFWNNDRTGRLGDNIPKLNDIVFHQKLGSVFDKTARVAALAQTLAEAIGADRELSAVAAKLAKADLVSEMVFEFPELQGVMGRYYALAEAGLDPLTGKGRVAKGAPYTADAARQVSDAIRDHYKPQGPSDDVPTAPVSVAVALADKLDTLVGFWAIQEKPTGSGDPYALRRAALGVIRIILENSIRLPLRSTLAPVAGKAIEAFDEAGFWKHASAQKPDGGAATLSSDWGPGDALAHTLLDFFADRLKVHLREEGHRHDLVDAVFALGADDLALIVKRVEALGAFLGSEDGANLLAGQKRAANILKAEEKKEKTSFAGDPDPALFAQDEERALYTALSAARENAGAAIEQEDFAGAMAALAPLRPAVDAFFDAVTVNDEDVAVRRNRLLLLSQIRDALHAVADFSKIEG